MEDTQELHYQQQLEQQQFEEEMKTYKIKFAYCDKIANTIKNALNANDPDRIIAGCGSVKFDLDEDGCLRSTSKTLFAMDRNGKQYKITVEEL